MFSKFAQAAALCVAAAAMSCGAAERSEVVDTESAALAPMPPVLYITISPGTLSGHPWTVPYDQQRTITLHVEDALGAARRSVLRDARGRSGGQQ